MCHNRFSIDFPLTRLKAVLTSTIDRKADGLNFRSSVEKTKERYAFNRCICCRAHRTRAPAKMDHPTRCTAFIFQRMGEGGK